jgi:hypothetical protein
LGKAFTLVCSKKSLQKTSIKLVEKSQNLSARVIYGGKKLIRWTKSRERKRALNGKQYQTVPSQAPEEKLPPPTAFQI